MSLTNTEMAMAWGNINGPPITPRTNELCGHLWYQHDTIHKCDLLKGHTQPHRCHIWPCAATEDVKDEARD